MVNTQQNRQLTDDEMHTLKGFSRLRYKSAEESLDDAKTSVRRWWWEFLRLSKDYWLICQTSKPYRIETQDERLADIYRYWGDIYNCTFEEWWLDRGPSVFMEKEAFPKVKEISRKPRERIQTKMLEDHLWVDIPLKLSKRTIQRQLGKILEEHQEQRLRNRLGLSTSEFKINPVQFRLHTLKVMHEVYALHREMVDKPKLFVKGAISHSNLIEKADLFRIGKLLRISPSNESLIGESSEVIKRQNRMRASVGRLLNRGELLIANCEIGIFPSFKSVPLTEQMRFTERQARKHEELENEWWKLDLTSNLSAGKIAAAKKIHYEDVEKTRDINMTDKRERVVIIRDA
jgi:hypothetical protein